MLPPRDSEWPIYSPFPPFISTEIHEMLHLQIMTGSGIAISFMAEQELTLDLLIPGATFPTVDFKKK